MDGKSPTATDGDGPITSVDPATTPDKPAPSDPTKPDPGASPTGSDPAKPQDAAALESGPPDLSIPGRCSSSTLRGNAEESVRRLTRTELERTLQTTFPSLFGYYSFPDEYFKPSNDVMSDYPEDVPEDPNEHFNPLHSEPQVSAWMEISDAFGGEVANSAEERERFGGACMKETAPDMDCWTAFTRKLGRTLFRRPLSDAELSALLEQHPRTDAKLAIQSIVSHLLRSPNTIFHIVAGTPDANGRVRLTQHEVAERLSFGLTSAPPDAELSAAADKGELGSLSQVRTHAQRLVSTDLAKSRVRSFVDEWLRVYNIPQPSPAQALPHWEYQSFGLAEMYRKELFEFVDYVLWNKAGSFTDLMTTAVAFPVEPKIADIYGVPKAAKGEAVPTPDHPGLLLRAGLLASGLDTTSPILRGVTVLRRVLCEALPSPNAAVVAGRLLELNALDPKTMPTHEIVTQVTSPDQCMICHSRINPMGFTFEAFNPLGIRKSVQDYVGPVPGMPAKLFASFPLPGPQTLSVDQGMSAKAYTDPNDLITAIAASGQARACMAVRLFRATHQRPEREADACALADAIEALERDLPVRDAIAVSVANEDIFWRKSQ